jgi:catechol 2,3-dioxygenase-like lactoylglutathione lyase family enzyme
MIDHISLGVADLNRSAAFYDEVLGKIGYVRLWTMNNAAGYGSPGGNDKLALFVTASVRAPGAGFHIAFTATSEEAVRQFHAVALQLGGTDAGLPGLRENYSPTYYAAFVFDLEGTKLEAVCQ